MVAIPAFHCYGHKVSCQVHEQSFKVLVGYIITIFLIGEFVMA